MAEPMNGREASAQRHDSDERTDMQADKRFAAVIGLAVAVFAALAAFGVIEFDDGVDTKTVTEPKAIVPEAIVVDNADTDAQPDNIVELGPAAREAAADFVEGEAPDVVVEDGDELRGDDDTPVAVLQAPFAADSINGCRTRFLTTNWSYRQPVAVIWFKLHFTAGRDIPGSRAEVDGLTAFGNNPASRVSWHFNLDKDGNCDYNVPLRYNAWAGADMNSRSVHTEVHGSGEAPYLRPGGWRKLARIFIQVRDAYPAIRLRVGSVSNCAPGSAGVVTHWMGGACSGGHTDIRPHDIQAVTAKLRRYVRHNMTHRLYRREGCRGSMHDTPLRELGRERCRDIKRRGHRQHLAL